MAPTNEHICRHEQAATAHALLQHHRRTRSGALDRHLPFSWTRCLISVFSYALLLSDVVRTGLGVRHLSQFPPMEPDTLLYFGPYAYSVVTLTPANATETASIPLWLYKYDTTSIGLRAIASHFRLPTWPKCALYEGTCAEANGIPFSTVFAMLDSVMDAFDSNGPSQLTLRAEVLWYDRLHQYIFPWFFQRNVRRTIQGLHYGDKILRAAGGRRLCGAQGPRPYFCGDKWTNFESLCFPSSPDYVMCRHVRDVWSHITERYRALAETFTNYSMELLVVESTEDFSRPSVVYHGRKFVDIVSLLRVQDCSRGPCVTTALLDYRYEADILTTSVGDWYPIIASIRTIGQIYAWARLVLLFAGCYYARASEPDTLRADIGQRLMVTIKTVLLIPSQVVIYGSVFPIACYVAAHLLDSAMVYELVSRQFRAILGQYDFHLLEVIHTCSISMRSVWVAALACHLVLAIWTHRSWSPTRGIPGIREFSISAVAGLTIFAQVRGTSWRNTQILQVHEVVSSAAHSRLHNHQHDTTKGLLNQLLLGSTFDAQCLSCSLLGLLSIVGIVRLLHWCMPRFVRRRIVLIARTPAPYGAGLLWPPNALVVTWSGSVTSLEGSSTSAHPPATPRRGIHPIPQKSTSVVVAPTSAPMGPSLPLRRVNVEHLFTQGSKAWRSSRFNVGSIARRGREVESMIYLINLAVMTDPLTFLRLRVLGGRLIGLYASRSAPQAAPRHVLLPVACAASKADGRIRWEDLELLLVLEARDLTWWDLLQCG